MSDQKLPSSNLAFLVSQLGFHVSGQFGVRLSSLDMDQRHFGLMNLIDGAEGRTQQQLADTSGIHRNAMVGLADDLEARGWVRRHPYPGDRRAYALHMTDEGRAVLGRARQIAQELEADLVGSLTEIERDQLGGLLAHLAAEAKLPVDVHIGMKLLGRINIS